MMRVLKDSTGLLAILINCRIDNDRLLCGAAVFKGGLSGEIDVSNGKTTYKIIIPDSVQKVATYQVFADSKDNLEIDLCVQ
ncbi:MAG: hypothetical protein ACKPE3_13615 [Sphaerospermopsis kisseleviana]